eukprot:1670327-Rhodomonas_salina.4
MTAQVGLSMTEAERKCAECRWAGEEGERRSCVLAELSAHTTVVYKVYQARPTRERSVRSTPPTIVYEKGSAIWPGPLGAPVPVR